MIYITGDIHRNPKRLTSKNWPEGTALTKSDYVIITGDFGLLWYGDKEEKYWLNWLHEKPWTTLFVDGNHENMTMLDALPEVKMFGKVVGKVNDSVYHLKRGYVYDIDGNKIFTFGGGLSIDKVHCTEGKSWWAREYPNSEEIERGWKELIDVGMEVDYVITHVPSEHGKKFCVQMWDDADKLHDRVSTILEDWDNVLSFKRWYCGHMHQDIQLNPKYIFMYGNIVELGKGQTAAASCDGDVYLSDVEKAGMYEKIFEADIKPSDWFEEIKQKYIKGI